MNTHCVKSRLPFILSPLSSLWCLSWTFNKQYCITSLHFDKNLYVFPFIPNQSSRAFKHSKLQMVHHDIKSSEWISSFEFFTLTLRESWVGRHNQRMRSTHEPPSDGRWSFRPDRRPSWTRPRLDRTFGIGPIRDLLVEEHLALTIVKSLLESCKSERGALDEWNQCTSNLRNLQQGLRGKSYFLISLMR